MAAADSSESCEKAVDDADDADVDADNNDSYNVLGSAARFCCTRNPRALGLWDFLPLLEEPAALPRGAALEEPAAQPLPAAS